MRAWLESDRVVALTDTGEWPTPDTAALWARFRTEALSGGVQKWTTQTRHRRLDVVVEDGPPAVLYRVVTDAGDGRTWLTSPVFQRKARFVKPAMDPKPNLLFGQLNPNTTVVDIVRIRHGKLKWPKADA